MPPRRGCCGDGSTCSLVLWAYGAAALIEPRVVESVDVLEGGELDLLGGAPGAAGLDELGLGQADHALGEGVVVGLADGSDRGADTGRGGSRAVNATLTRCATSQSRLVPLPTGEREAAI
jgi:hypothetical protein